MSKNDMKLIMEGWRQSLKEMNAVQTGGVQTGAVTKKEEINEEELDEGLKEIGLVAGLMSLIGVGMHQPVVLKDIHIVATSRMKMSLI